jgi:ribosomal protein L20A (L18A)
MPRNRDEEALAELVREVRDEKGALARILAALAVRHGLSDDEIVASARQREIPEDVAQRVVQALVAEARAVSDN